MEKWMDGVDKTHTSWWGLRRFETTPTGLADPRPSQTASLTRSPPPATRVCSSSRLPFASPVGTFSQQGFAMPAESQSQNSVRGAPLAQDQPQKPNPLPDHMKVPLITRHAPAQPKTKNPTPTTNQSRTCSEISALIDFKLLGSIFGIVFLVWFVLWFGPSINDFSAFTLSSATVHPFNISSSRLTAAWDISFDVDSLHLKRGVEYDHVHASIYYGPHLLSEVTIPSIFVRMFGTTTVHARLVVHSALVDVGAAESMVRDRALRGAVDFRFGLVARYIRLPLPWDTWVIRVSCENVTVGFPASDDAGPGVLLGPPRKCSHLVDET